jgi:hypothetical protein
MILRTATENCSHKLRYERGDFQLAKIMIDGKVAAFFHSQ